MNVKLSEEEQVFKKLITVYCCLENTPSKLALNSCDDALKKFEILDSFNSHNGVIRAC
jgi:hypothetical protein